jgi:hypothetical protein
MSQTPTPFQHHVRDWPDLEAHPRGPEPISTEATDSHATPTGVVLAGHAGGLREEAVRHLGTTAPVIAQIDHAVRLTDIIRAQSSKRRPVPPFTLSSTATGVS